MWFSSQSNTLWKQQIRERTKDIYAKGFSFAWCLALQRSVGLMSKWKIFDTPEIFSKLLRCSSKPCFKERYGKEFRIIDKCKHLKIIFTWRHWYCIKYFYFERNAVYTCFYWHCIFRLWLSPELKKISRGSISLIVIGREQNDKATKKLPSTLSVS